MASGKNSGALQSALGKIKGDKVVWMIVIILMLFSVVCIFSSTSQMARKGTTRIDMLLGQLKFLAGGLAVVFVCYRFIPLKLFKWGSRFGFLISLFFLTLLAAHKPIIPGLTPMKLNGEAWRILKVGGAFDLHVFEVTKVLMVMYLAWAMDHFKKGEEFFLVDILTRKGGNLWAESDLFKEAVYIYGPIGLITLLTLGGSGSSAIFSLLIMVATVIVGGLNTKKTIGLGVGIAALGLVAFGIYKVSDGKVFSRLATVESRISYKKNVEAFMADAYGSKDYYEHLSHFQQPYGAIEAIKEGGVFGKGAGASTQRHRVTMIFEDFMYSFIIEEYGLLGGLLVLILYISLLARGDMIARNCDDEFGKLTVAGLVMLISFQAFLHMMVNVGLIPMTGQTLPMISHGRSAMLMVCFSFGVILCISRISSKKVDKEISAAGSIMQEHHDEVQNSMYDLDQMEDQL